MARAVRHGKTGLVRRHRHGDALRLHARAPGPRYAGKSTIEGSQRSSSAQDLRTPDATDAATANVYVPPAELSPSRATTAVAPPPTWPTNPQPIGPADTAVNAPSSGFDWDSAGLGAGAAAAAFAIALAATAGVRRRRSTRPRSVATP